MSDLHYTLKQLDWVASVAADYDLVVIAGDLLDIASIVEPDAQIAVSLEYLARLAAKTTRRRVLGQSRPQRRATSYGERAAPWLERGDRIGSLRRRRRALETDALLVTVCPWWDGPRSCERSTASSRPTRPRRRPTLDLGVPRAADGSPTSWTGKRHYGDEDSSAWIEHYQPDIVLCGHVHQSPFATDGGWIDRIGTDVVFNAGRQTGPVPTRIEIDTDAAAPRGGLVPTASRSVRSPRA